MSTHRVHHQLSDQEGDPHTPREGGWWAHTGWILFGEALHAQTEVLARYSPTSPRPLPCVAEQISLASDHGERRGCCFALGWLDLGRMGERRWHAAVGRASCA